MKSSFKLEFVRRRRRRWTLLVGILAAFTFVNGCGGPPQVPRYSRKLIESLRTAVSAHRTDWLEANAKLVEQQFSQGKLSDEQHEAFQSIIARLAPETGPKRKSRPFGSAKLQRGT